LLISHRSIKMNSELEQVVDLLQEYVIRLQAAAPVQKPIIKLETKAIESIESIQVNKKHLFEEKQEKQETHNDNSKSYLFHVTRDKDKLFWAFYIMLNGEDAYKYLKTKFVTEKEIKIGAVEKMRKLPNVFKQHKLNKVRIENELSGDVPLTLEGFYGLCIIYNISAIFMKKNCYCELYGLGDSSVTHIIEELEGGLGVHVFKMKEASSNFVKRVRESKWKMENVLTPIKSISSYTHAELLEIYNKVVCINNKETTGFMESFKEKKTKQFLYDRICEFLN
jgi:hypothetical protein